MIVPYRPARPFRAGQGASDARGHCPYLQRFKLNDIALQLRDERIELPQGGLGLGQAGLDAADAELRPLLALLGAHELTLSDLNSGLEGRSARG